MNNDKRIYMIDDKRISMFPAAIILVSFINILKKVTTSVSVSILVSIYIDILIDSDTGITNKLITSNIVLVSVNIEILIPI